MDNLRRPIIVGYCIAILVVVLYVPWKVTRYNDNGVLINVSFGHSFLFSPPVPGATVVDYGVVILEVVAITAIAVILFILRDKLSKYMNSH